MAKEVYDVISNVPSASGDMYYGDAPDDEAFLRNVITPIYRVLRKVVNTWL